MDRVSTPPPPARLFFDPAGGLSPAGRLAKGGTVLVDIADGKPSFSYFEVKAPAGRVR